MHAFRINSEITLDGKLDEESWIQAETAIDFIQSQPIPGTGASHATSVKILYDDKAVYVAAKMFDDDVKGIKKELVIRDNEGNADRFGVSFDTYGDGLNAFSFIVSAAGVQQDIRITPASSDNTWDAVWQSEVKIDDDGWTVEMLIPLNALRFPNAENQSWKVQFFRDIRRLREESYWNEVKPEVSGVVNQFGYLHGISNVKSGVRLSFNPYFTTYLNTRHHPDISGSFSSSTSYTAGMDVKYGIDDAFTLDMTLIPDFGQTISDKKVLNLSPFEVYFEENRAFFTEGLELYNKSNMFYTRRIGGSPIDFYAPYSHLQEGDILLENPTTTNLINATKLSGRTTGNTGLGFFNGIINESKAIIQDNMGNKRDVLTNPITNYNILVFDQSLKNNSYVTIMNSNVTRWNEYYDANATGMFTRFRDKNQNYELRLNGIYDAKYGGKPEEKFDNGYKFSSAIAKVSGAWTYEVNQNFESVHFDINDAGYIASPNKNSYGGELAYRQYKPKNEKLILYNFELYTFYSRLHQPNVFTDHFTELSYFRLYKSRFAYGLNARLEPIPTRDYFEPRTSDYSKYLDYPVNYTLGGFISSDYRKAIAIDARINFRWYDSEGRRNYSMVCAPRIRVNNHLSVSWTTALTWLMQEPGYVNKNIADYIPELQPNDILMGVRDRQDIENTLSANLIFNNRMGANFRVRHYWSNVIYTGFGALKEDGKLREINFSGNDENGDPIYNTNYNLFTVDLQYQWRFAPGSDLIVVWKNNIFNADNNSDLGYFRGLKNLFDTFQDNSISLRAVYFLDYQKIFG